MNRFTRSFAAGLFAAASVALVGGCSSDGIFGSDDDDDDRPSQIDTGTRVPREARMVAQGDDTLRYRAPSDGRIYLFDANDDVVIDARDIGQGREYIVAPADDRAWIDQNRVLDHDFARGHEHRLYFLSDRDSSSSNDGGFDAGEVPKSATIVREGRGDLSYEAGSAGVVYVYDVGGNDVVTSARVRNGQRFTVSPESGEVSVDGRVVSRESLNSRKTYRLYFDESA